MFALNRGNRPRYLRRVRLKTCPLDDLEPCDLATPGNQFSLPLQQLLALLVQLLPKPMSIAGAGIFWRSKIACMAITSFPLAL
jgi:hypothetical protein